ncbi:MAG: hypothetical protein V2B14_01945 [bacterium]
MYYHNNSVYVEKNDQCMTCKNFTKGVACPLLQALAMGLVTLEGTLYVKNCGFYEESVRHLKLVPNKNEELNKKNESKD